MLLVKGDLICDGCGRYPYWKEIRTYFNTAKQEDYTDNKCIFCGYVTTHIDRMWQKYKIKHTINITQKTIRFIKDVS